MSVLAALHDVTLQFGGVVALSGVTWSVTGGGMHAIIGPNGAGKSTLFNLLTGIYRPTSGAVRVHEQDIASLKTHQVAALGLARTFQNIRLLPHLTVLQNLCVVAASERAGTFWAALMGIPKATRQAQAIELRALTLLDAMGLSTAAKGYPTALSYGAQRKVEIARALMRKPALLLLDEPAAGMNSSEKADLARILKSLVSPQMTVVLIEHDMRFVMGMCDDVTVLHQGKICTRGSPAQVQADPQVIRVYLGK